MTVPPACFSTGMLSPVSADSSTADAPSSTTPSTGTLSPALTMSTSPGCTSAAGMMCSVPLRSTVAVLGARSMSFVIASEVLPLARASMVLPMVMSVRIVPADSKYSSII